MAVQGGFVVPLFLEQIRRGRPVTVTTVEMTRFLLSLNQVVDTLHMAVRHAQWGKIVIPRIRSANIMDLVAALIRDCAIKIEITGIRPGEKTPHILVSDEEGPRIFVLNDQYYIIRPMLPESQWDGRPGPALVREYTSYDDLLDAGGVRDLLQAHGLLDGGALLEGELPC